MSRRVFSCPICAGSMREIDLDERELRAEIQRLSEACEFLMSALKRVKERPAQESAWIAAVCLDQAHKTYQVRIV